MEQSHVTTSLSSVIGAGKGLGGGGAITAFNRRPDQTWGGGSPRKRYLS